MIQFLDKNGQPVKINIKTAVLVAAIALGGFTGGASFPELNPLSLFGTSCASE
jgi:hypothetical protein